MNLQTNRNTPNKFQTLIENMKSKISSQVLKQNFTAQHVAGVFENLLTGNEFLNNIEVKDLAIFDKLEISDLLKLKEMAEMEELSVKSFFRTNLFNITDDNEIIFEDEAVIRIRNSPIAFKARDIFEVIAFLKFMMNVCGNQMEKCDFNTLLKNSFDQQKIDLMKVFKDRFNKNKEEMSKIYSEFKNNFYKSDDDAKKISLEPSKNNLKDSQRNNSDNLLRNRANSDEFAFKEQYSKVDRNTINNNTDVDEQSKKQHVEREIDDLLEYEFKAFKENSSINEYENFYNNIRFQKYLEKYYYEGI
jgi:hypothetical protein